MLKNKQSVMSLYLITALFEIICVAIVSYALPISDENGAGLYLRKFGHNDFLKNEHTVSTEIKDFKRLAPPNKTGSKWPVKELTYHVSQHTSRIKDSSEVKNEISQAFKIWRDITTLNLKEKVEGQVDIDIRFAVKQHGDGDPSDGSGKTLSHAQLPQYDAHAHFDDEKMRTSNEGIGPASPPPHSDNKDVEILDRPSGTSDAQDLCQDATIDAITRIKSGDTYAFKGNFYWKILDVRSVRFLKSISDDWDGLEGNLDAAVTWSNGKTYFFKDNRYWSFTNRKMDSGYPKLISVGFEGIPDNLDAALVWSGNGKTYFFKGDKYWRYDIGSVPPVKSDYPMKIKEWSCVLENGIDAALQWENGRTYLFKGDQYYRYNDDTSEIDVDPAYPRSTAKFWFNCQESYHNTTAWARKTQKLDVNTNEIKK